MSLPAELRHVIRSSLLLRRPVSSIRLAKQPRRWSSVSQSPGSSHVHFPGAVNSKFTSTLKFERPDQQAAIETYRVMDSDGIILDKGKERDLEIADEEVLKLYRDMLTVSILDTIMYDAQRQGRISFYMVSAGEESIAIGSSSSLSPHDIIFAQYRETGVFLHRGFPLSAFMAQLFSTTHDAGRGRNIAVHYGSAPLNMHTISSPLATQLPHAAGAAYAVKLQDAGKKALAKRVVACYFGEGAASEGDFHAALNIAATRACPVVYICRNNGFAISTPTLEQYRGDGIASRGVGYGIETVRVDGNDIFAMREVVARARTMALEGGGKPVLVEAMSYRVSHHSTSDDSFAYRAKVEVEEWKRRDNPISRLRKWMERKGIWDDDTEREARIAIRKEVLREFAKAERDKLPPLREMFTDVYEQVTEDGIREMAELKRIIETYPEEYDVSEYEGGKASLAP